MAAMYSWDMELWIHSTDYSPCVFSSGLLEFRFRAPFPMRLVFRPSETAGRQCRTRTRGRWEGGVPRPHHHHPDRPTPSPPRERGRRSTSPPIIPTPRPLPLRSPRAGGRTKEKDATRHAPFYAPAAARLLCCRAEAADGQPRTRTQPAPCPAVSGHILTVREDSPPGVPCAVARLHSDTAVLRHHALVPRREMLRLVRPACARCTDEVPPRPLASCASWRWCTASASTRPCTATTPAFACHTWKGMRTGCRRRADPCCHHPTRTSRRSATRGRKPTWHHCAVA